LDNAVLIKESEERSARLLTVKLQPLSDLVTKVGIIEKTVSNLKLNLSKLETRDRKKNIVIFGIKEPENESARHILSALEGLSNSLGLQKAFDYDDAFRMGKKDSTKDRPLLVKLLRYRDKQELMRSRMNLKGTSISVKDDCTPEERKMEAALRKKKYEIMRTTPTAECRIRGEVLVVQHAGKTTTWTYNHQSHDVIQGAVRNLPSQSTSERMDHHPS
jgi:hypothetical protein